MHTVTASPYEFVGTTTKAYVEVRLHWAGELTQYASTQRGAFSLHDLGMHLPERFADAGLAKLVETRAGMPVLTVPKDATGWRYDGLRTVPVAAGQSIELESGRAVRLSWSECPIVVDVTWTHEAAGAFGGLWAGADLAASKHVGASFAAHLGMLAALAFFVPSLGPDDSEAMDRDRILLMQKMVNASAEREREPEPEPAGGDTQGQKAAGPEGASGKPDAPVTHARRAVAKTEYDTAGLTRGEMRQIVERDSVISLLAEFTQKQAGVESPWAALARTGFDPVNTAGGMFGDVLGDTNGTGLGLHGLDQGGGFGCEGCYGVGTIGTLGRGTGNVPGPGHGDDGSGRGHGRLPGEHKVKVPRITEANTVVNGHLPAEIIQRVVRNNFGKFRFCYEGGLRGNPSLHGRVMVNFVIARDGSVSTASDGGSDLQNADVVSCVVRSFANLSFPSPEGGIVTVRYPIVFQPGE